MADTKTEPNIPVDRDSADNVVCVLTDPFEVGDCQMNVGAQVNLNLVDPNAGTVTVIWDADVFTRHTTFGDQWHQSFNFKTRHGTSVVQVGGLDGPSMDNENEVKHAHVERTISVDPDLFDSIRTVDWTGEC
jgi:hypothetical protein